MGIIYLAKNKVNSKGYIGQTTRTLEWRKTSHWQAARAGMDYLFLRALLKYGLDAFEWSIIFDNVADAEMDELETEAIAVYRTQVPKGYNLLSGGGSHGRHSELSKLKMSNSLLGKIRTDAFKQRVSEVHTGRKDTPATKLRRSAAHKGKRHTEAARKKIAEVQRGRKATQETKSKMSKSHMGHSTSQETKDRISVALQSREGNARLREASVKNREKRSLAAKAYQSNRRFVSMSLLYMPTVFV